MKNILIIGMMVGLAALLGCEQSARDAGSAKPRAEAKSEPSTKVAADMSASAAPKVSVTDQLRWVDESEPVVVPQTPAQAAAPAASADVIGSSRTLARIEVSSAGAAHMPQAEPVLAGSPLAAALDVEIVPADDYVPETGSPIVLPQPAAATATTQPSRVATIAAESAAAAMRTTTPAASAPAAAAAPAPAPMPAATPATPLAASPTTRTYVVAEGDTLWSIAVAYYGTGQKWEAIAKANGITDVSQVAAGRTLIMP